MAVNFFPKLDIGGTGSLDDYIALTEKGSANGVATLDSTSKIPSNQLPNISITDTFVVGSQSALLALTAQVGDVAIRTDLNKSFILQSEPASVLGNWVELLTPPDTVLSVDGKTGVVNLSDKYQALSNELSSLSTLVDTPGFIKKTGDGTYSIDANTYLTNNQTITLSGDVTGSGTTSINATLPNIVTAGSSAKPTYNAKGLITGSGSLLDSDIPTLGATKIINTAVTLSDNQTITGRKIFANFPIIQTDAPGFWLKELDNTAQSLFFVLDSGIFQFQRRNADDSFHSTPASVNLTTGVFSATSFSGIGTSLTALNASNLSSGTIPDARLAGNYSGISSLFRPGTTNALFLRGGNETIGSGAIIHLYGKDNLGGQAYLDSGAFNFRSLGGASSYGKISSTGIEIYASTIATSTTTGAVTVNGGVGVQGNQYIGGFSSLGGDANHPAIKIKVLTGTTNSTEGGTASVTHEITSSKIVSISVLVEYAAGAFIPDAQNIGPGYYFDFYSDSVSVFVRNKVANSSNILSKPFKVTIIYTA